MGYSFTVTKGLRLALWAVGAFGLGGCAQVSSTFSAGNSSLLSCTNRGADIKPELSFNRFNRGLYNNAIRELTGLSGDFATQYFFPGDSAPEGGFDNDASSLAVDENLLTKLMNAAEGIIPKALAATGANQKILSCNPASGASAATQRSCALDILKKFGRRAYSRPLTSDEITRLSAVMDLSKNAGGAFKDQLGLALQSILISPNFVYRIMNPQAAGSSPDYVLAAGMAAFLWNSIPDETLLSLAENGTLHDPDTLSAQVERMLADPRSEALVNGFAAQYLRIRDLDESEPDPSLYPDFDETLRTSMHQETARFFRSIKDENRSLYDLLDSKTSFVNKRLAQYYGLDASQFVDNNDYRRVDVSSVGRRGVLLQGTVLVATSHSTATSPVRRGYNVLANFLCSEPPPPPDNVSTNLPPPDPNAPAFTARQRFSDHAKLPQCMACHNMMDPIGFAFEKYDGIGSRRETENGVQIDTAGVLPTSDEAFAGADELISIVREKPNFPACVTRKLMTYAFSRQLSHPEQCDSIEIAAQSTKEGFKFADVVKGIVSNMSLRLQAASGD